MKRFGLVLAFCTFLCGQALAQVGLPFPGPGALAAAASYTGPADVVASPGFWVGLRAVSAADRGNALLNVCNIGDATCSDVSSSATTGSLTSFATIGAQTCSYTVSSGTYTSGTGAVSLTLGSSSPLVSSNTFGVGVLTGTGTLASLNGVFTATAGTTGTTVNYTAASGLGSITITGGSLSVCSIKTFYDRSGALACGGSACNLTATSTRAYLLSNCLNSLPCAVASSLSASYSSTLTVASQASGTMSAVASRFANFTTTQLILVVGLNSANLFQLNFRALANAIQMFAGTSGVFISNITDANFHALQAVFNGASSQLMCGGSAGTACSASGVDNSLSPGAVASSVNGAFSLFAGNSGTAAGAQAYLTEAGFWPTVFNGTQRTNMNANQYTYWGPF